MKKIVSALICSYALIATATADISSDLNGFFQGLGMNSNNSGAAAYHGQQAGYYTGGSVFARRSVRNLQLATISLPSYRTGCGGIDLHMGAFSFVDKDAIVGMARNIINGAKGYAFNLALETVTPQISNGMKYFMDQANKINQASINSCEMSSALVGGLWPKTQVSQRNVCRDIGTSHKYNMFADWAEARQECSAGAQTEAALNHGNQDDDYKEGMVDNINIVWTSIRKNALFYNASKEFVGRELAELFMSLSGTVIFTRDSAGKIKENGYPSLATDKNLLKALLSGGETKIYHCDEEEKCLHPTESTITVKQENALMEKTGRLIASMLDKVQPDASGEEGELSQEEIAFLQATSIPVYKLISVQAAFMRNKSVIDLGEYTEIIAADILYQYLIDNLHLVRNSLEHSQIPEPQKKRIVHSIEMALANLRNEQRNFYQRMQVKENLIEKTQMLERMLAGQLSSKVTNSIEWARGIQ